MPLTRLLITLFNRSPLPAILPITRAETTRSRSDLLRITGRRSVNDDPHAGPAEALAAYLAWLPRQPLAPNSRRTYRVRVAQYCAYLASTPSAHGDPLADPH